MSKKNGIRCCNCGKLLAEDSQMKIGHIKITCKCGVTNTIIASVEEAGTISPEVFAQLGKEKREIMHLHNHIPGERLVYSNTGSLTEYGKQFFDEIK